MVQKLKVIGITRRNVVTAAAGPGLPDLLRLFLPLPRGLELEQALGVFVVEFLEDAARKSERLRLAAAVGDLACPGVVIEVGLVAYFE